MWERDLDSTCSLPPPSTDSSPSRLNRRPRSHRPRRKRISRPPNCSALAIEYRVLNCEPPPRRGGGEHVESKSFSHLRKSTQTINPLGPSESRANSEWNQWMGAASTSSPSPFRTSANRHRPSIPSLANHGLSLLDIRASNFAVPRESESSTAARLRVDLIRQQVAIE